MIEINLTDREHQVLLILLTGASNKEIADKLCIATRTVEGHITRLLSKSNSKNRSEIISKHFSNDYIFKIYNSRNDTKYIQIINMYIKDKYSLQQISNILEANYNYVNTIIVKYKKGEIKL